MLRLNNINAYYGYIHALKDVTFEIPKGKIIALLGANGAGKTTTLKVISGLLHPRTGTVEFEGQDISNLSVEKIVSKSVIQCPEGRQIFSDMTVKENLLAGAYSRKDKRNINRSINRIYDYFPRLKQREKQIGGTLSGGEQQMLSIGRALMANPKLLLLDEPSLGLAPLIVKEIVEIIREVNKEGTTILLVEQNVNQALSIADYAYILETGNIVHEGKANVLKNDAMIKKAYLGSV